MPTETRLDQEMDKLRDIMSSLQDENHQMKDENEKMKKQISEICAKILDLEIENKKLHDLVIKAFSENEKLKEVQETRKWKTVLSKNYKELGVTYFKLNSVFDWIMPYGKSGELMIKTVGGGCTGIHKDFYKTEQLYNQPGDNGFVKYCSVGNRAGKLFTFKSTLETDPSKSGGDSYSFHCRVTIIHPHVQSLLVAFERELC